MSEHLTYPTGGKERIPPAAGVLESAVSVVDRMDKKIGQGYEI